MFAELHSGSFRRQSAVVGSVVAHLGFLALLLLRPARPLDLTPRSLAFGNGELSYRVIYLPRGDETVPGSRRPILWPHSKASRPHLEPITGKPREQLSRSSAAETSGDPARAGSLLGTMIDGPITGHEVRVAYPVVFPDPTIVRSELPSDLSGDVIVEVTIDAQGNVAETRLLQAIGHGIDEKVIAAVRHWHFQPAMVDGMPVASKHDVHFHFPS